MGSIAGHTTVVLFLAIRSNNGGSHPVTTEFSKWRTTEGRCQTDEDHTRTFGEEPQSIVVIKRCILRQGWSSRMK
jgi:hypothetical protein